MALILTRPANSNTGVPGTTFGDIIVSASATVVLDSFPEANNHGAKWFIIISEPVGTKIRSYEIFGMNRFGVSAEHNRYSQLGDFIDHDIDVQINAGNMELVITNNEIVNIECHIVRIQVIHS